MQEAGDNLDEATKSQLNGTIEKLKKAMESEDTEEIKKLTEELTQASHKLAESIYAKAAEQAQAAGGADASGSTAEASRDEDVVDADFEEVKK